MTGAIPRLTRSEAPSGKPFPVILTIITVNITKSSSVSELVLSGILRGVHCRGGLAHYQFAGNDQADILAANIFQMIQ